MSDPPAPAADPAEAQLVRRHLRVGWWTVLVFLAMGLALESMHGFKLDWYLNVANETRRSMFRLAHSHGALVGLVHLGFAFTLARAEAAPGAWRRVASLCLLAATALLPGGFLLGGLWFYGGDPGRGILLVPFGALALLAAALLAATRGVGRARP